MPKIKSSDSLISKNQLMALCENGFQDIAIKLGAKAHSIAYKLKPYSYEGVEKVGHYLNYNHPKRSYVLMAIHFQRQQYLEHFKGKLFDKYLYEGFFNRLISSHRVALCGFLTQSPISPLPRLQSHIYE
jgi:hypothetical protein